MRIPDFHVQGLGYPANSFTPYSLLIVPGKSFSECLALLVAGTILSQCILNVFVAITYRYFTLFASNKCQKMVNLIALSDSFAEFGYTAYFVRDNRLIIVDHRILIGCNTFLRTTRAFSHDIYLLRTILKRWLNFTCHGICLK